MIVCLAVACLLLLGLTQKPDLSTVPSSIDAVKETVQHMTLVPSFKPKNVRVGIQIGHFNAINQPDELERLRYSTGGSFNGVNEVDINKATAYMLSEMLEHEGIVVDLLPATIPPNYDADLVISIHADSSPEAYRRGYKSAHFRHPRNKWEPILKRHIDSAYFYYSGLPDDDQNVSGSMLEYYAFNRASFKHTVSRSTPALIVEMGYLSHPEDLAFISDPVNPAYALKRGILAYLTERGRFVPEN